MSSCGSNTRNYWPRRVSVLCATHAVHVEGCTALVRSPGANSLSRRIWAELPEFRPTFQRIFLETTFAGSNPTCPARQCSLCGPSGRRRCFHIAIAGATTSTDMAGDTNLLQHCHQLDDNTEHRHEQNDRKDKKPERRIILRRRGASATCRAPRIALAWRISQRWL